MEEAASPSLTPRTGFIFSSVFAFVFVKEASFSVAAVELCSSSNESHICHLSNERLTLSASTVCFESAAVQAESAVDNMPVWTADELQDECAVWAAVKEECGFLNVVLQLLSAVCVLAFRLNSMRAKFD